MPLSVVGSLLCTDPAALTETDIRNWCVTFVGVAVPQGTALQDTQVSIVVEGEHDQQLRPLGTTGLVRYTRTNALAFQRSILAWQQHKVEPMKAPAQSQITLGIGSAVFCAAHLAFTGLILSNDARNSIVDIIDELRKAREWDAFWFDAGKPEELHRDNLMEIVISKD